MDEEIKRIIKSTFTEDDARIVEEMLNVIENDLSNANRAKRVKDVDYILSMRSK